MNRQEAAQRLRADLLLRLQHDTAVRDQLIEEVQQLDIAEEVWEHLGAGDQLRETRTRSMNARAEISNQAASIALWQRAIEYLAVYDE